MVVCLYLQDQEEDKTEIEIGLVIISQQNRDLYLREKGIKTGEIGAKDKTASRTSQNTLYVLPLYSWKSSPNHCALQCEILLLLFCLASYFSACTTAEESISEQGVHSHLNQRKNFPWPLTMSANLLLSVGFPIQVAPNGKKYPGRPSSGRKGSHRKDNRNQREDTGYTRREQQDSEDTEKRRGKDNRRDNERSRRNSEGRDGADDNRNFNSDNRPASGRGRGKRMDRNDKRQGAGSDRTENRRYQSGGSPAADGRESTAGDRNLGLRVTFGEAERKVKIHNKEEPPRRKHEGYHPRGNARPLFISCNFFLIHSVKPKEKQHLFACIEKNCNRCHFWLHFGWTNKCLLKNFQLVMTAHLQRENRVRAQCTVVASSTCQRTNQTKGTAFVLRLNGPIWFTAQEHRTVDWKFLGRARQSRGRPYEVMYVWRPSITLSRDGW